MVSVDVIPVKVDITVMGSFAVAVDGVPTAASGWARRSAAALVKVLALAPGHFLHREHVMDLLWPNEPPSECAPRLHKAAYFARRAGSRPDVVVLREDGVWLFPGSEVTVDAIRFEDLARAAVTNSDPGAAREALDWYRGELLPGDRYEDWADDRRELLHLRRLDVLRVAGEWRELAEIDKTNEGAHLELVRRHLAAGNRAAAVRQYEYLRHALEEQLGVAPECCRSPSPARRGTMSTATGCAL
jgi:DNA-binding SARP family transcriptional activator